MADIITPNMGLTLPTVLVSPGPDYAVEINADLVKVDSHDHTPGKGELITTAALNIDENISINNNYVQEIFAAQFKNQSFTLTGPDDINEIYVFAGDLYYNNAAGTVIKLTNGSVINNPSVNLFNLQTINSNITVPSNATYNFLEVDTSGAAIAITLPAVNSITQGRFFWILDVSNNAQTNHITLIRQSGDTFNSVNANLVLDTNLAGCLIVADGISNWNVFYTIPRIMLEGRYGTDIQNVIVKGSSVLIEAVGSNGIIIGDTSNNTNINGNELQITTTTAEILSPSIVIGNGSSVTTIHHTLSILGETNFTNNVTIATDGVPRTTTIGLNNADSLVVPAQASFSDAVTISGHFASSDTSTPGVGSFNNLFSGTVGVGGKLTVANDVLITGISLTTELQSASVGTTAIALVSPLQCSSHGRIVDKVAIGSGAAGPTSVAAKDNKYIVSPVTPGVDMAYQIDASNCFPGDTITFVNRSGNHLFINDDSGATITTLQAASGASSPHLYSWCTFCYLPTSTVAPFFTFLLGQGT